MFRAALEFLQEHLEADDPCSLYEIRFTNFDKPTVTVFTKQVGAFVSVGPGVAFGGVL